MVTSPSFVGLAMTVDNGQVGGQGKGWLWTLTSKKSPSHQRALIIWINN